MTIGSVITKALPILVVLIWELGSRAGLVDLLIFPAPSRIITHTFSILLDGTLIHQFGISIGRVAQGVLFGGGFGLILGLSMGLSQRVNLAADGLVSVTHPMPKIALLPLFLIFFGYGETARIVLVSLSAMFPMIIAARTAVHSMDYLLLDVCEVYGVTGVLRLRKMILPACAPVVLAGLRLAISTALIVTISVEMLAANDGLGSLLWLGWQTMRLEDIYSVLLIIGVFGLGISKFIGYLEQQKKPWRYR